MSFPGNSPSNILREALLEYSQNQRSGRERQRRRHRRDRPQPAEEPPVPPQEQEPAPHVEPVVQPPTGDIASPLVSAVNSFDSGIASHGPKSMTEIFPKTGEDEKKIVPKSNTDLQTDDSNDKEERRESRDAGLIEDALTFNEDYEQKGCCQKKYHVAHNLADGDTYYQSRFIQKVFAMILVKALILLAYLSLVEMLDDFKNFYKQTFKYHFISIGLYLVMKITIRLTKNFRRRNRCFHLMLHIMDIIALGDFLGGAMSDWLPDYVYFVVPRKILYSIAGSSLFFIYVGWFVEYDMKDGIMLGSAFIVNGLTGLHQVLHGTIRGYGFDPQMGKVSDEWTSVLIVLGVSELIMMWIMFELKSVLTGYRYSVWYTDWFFTGVYVI